MNSSTDVIGKDSESERAQRVEACAFVRKFGGRNTIACGEVDVDPG